MSEQNTNLANALLNFSWSEMDDFAEHIQDIAINDSGEVNCNRHISQCLITWAETALEAREQTPFAKDAERRAKQEQSQ